MKTKIIPFDAEMAKKIQAGEIEGRICTKEGNFTARIICFDKVKLVHGDGTTEYQIVSLTHNDNAREEVLFIHNKNGEVQTVFNWEHGYDLVLEVPETITNREIYGETDAYGEPIHEDEEYFVCEHCGGVCPEGDRHSSYLGDVCGCCFVGIFG